jgi:hypothetical protein
MTCKFYLTCLGIVLTLVVNGQTKNIPVEMTANRIACKLTSPELQKRKATVIAALKALVLEKQELENGYSFRFDGGDEILDQLTEFIKTERLCCNFFTFQLTVEDTVVELRLTGPEGAKAFIAEEIGL